MFSRTTARSPEGLEASDGRGTRPTLWHVRCVRFRRAWMIEARDDAELDVLVYGIDVLHYTVTETQMHQSKT